MTQFQYTCDRLIYIALCFLAFLIGNGSIEILLPDIEISVGGNLHRYITILVIFSALTLLISPPKRELTFFLLRNPLSIVLAILFIAAVLSPNRLGNLREYVDLLLGYFLCLTVAIHLKGEQKNNPIFVLLIIGQLIMLTIGLKSTIEETSLVIGNYKAIHTPVGDVQASSVFFATFPSLMIYFILVSKKSIRYVCTAIFIIVSIATIFVLWPPIISGAYIISALMIGIYHIPKTRTLVITTLTLGVVNIIFGFFLVCGQFDFQQLYEIVIDIGGFMKQEMMIITAVWRDFPLSGIGTCKESMIFFFPQYSMNCEEQLCHPSSLLSYLLIGYGFIGGISMVIISYFIFIFPNHDNKTRSHERHTLKLSVRVSLLSLIFGLVLYNPMENERLMIILWLMLGCYLHTVYMPQYLSNQSVEIT